jgi:hypothetical protein
MLRASKHGVGFFNRLLFYASRRRTWPSFTLS